MRRLYSSVSAIAEPPISDADLGVRIGFAISDETDFSTMPAPTNKRGDERLNNAFRPRITGGFILQQALFPCVSRAAYLSYISMSLSRCS